MSEKEMLLIMTLLDLLGKPTHPNKISLVYEHQKEMFARRNEPSIYEKGDIKTL